MNSLTTLCIFIVILFLYIHIANQFKKSDDLEIYETDFQNIKHLEDVCELKQPILMNISDILPNLFSDITPEKIARFSSHDVNVKDIRDYYTDKNDSVDPICLPFNTTIQFLESDNQGHLFSENNQEFLDESGLKNKFQTVDHILKPSFSVNTRYDLWFGAKNTVTPLRYHTDSRQFLCITGGKIRVKMTHWKSTKYLHPYKDYEKYEFCSPVHPRNPDKSYTFDFDKTNFMEFDVKAGYMLYIPPYWWYSISYLDDPSTYVCSVTYNSLVNCLSNSWDLSLYFLQQQNIKQKPDKTFEQPKDIIQSEEIIKEPSSTPLDEIEIKPSIVQEVEMQEEKEEKEEESNVTTVIKPLLEKENIEYTISSI